MRGSLDADRWTWQRTAVLASLVGAVSAVIALGWRAVSERIEPGGDPSLALDSAIYETLATLAAAGGDAAPGLSWRWRFDDSGRVAEFMAPGGVTTRLSVSATKPPVGAYAEGRSLFVRDAMGRLLRAERGGRNLELEYGSTGTLATLRQDGAPPVRYRYDALDRVVEMRIEVNQGDDGVVQYAYDYLGRLARIGTSVGDVTYSYHSVPNTVIRHLPNGVQTVREFDGEGIFHELRRIALITAIAERLRDSGEPMPLWMRDYRVVPFPIDSTTPSLTIKKPRTVGMVEHTARIYGGVNLAPADKDIRSYRPMQGGGYARTDSSTAAVPALRSDPSPVALEDRRFVDLSAPRAASLVVKIPELARADQTKGESRRVATPDGKVYSAAALPGASTTALAPNRQTVADIIVPIGPGRDISVTRHYNSFLDPEGEFGRGWTMNLPELQKSRVPVARDGKASRYRVTFNLINPLGTLNVRFDRVAKVAPYEVEMLVAPGNPQIAGVIRARSEIVGSTTHQVVFRHGRTWHFDDSGRLVLIEEEGTATRFVRDAEDRIRQIAAYVGTNAVADIRLSYDRKARLVRATASQADYLAAVLPASAAYVAYHYGDNGRLVGVMRPDAGLAQEPELVWRYRYDANLLAGIGGKEKEEVAFKYNDRGQLVSHETGGQARVYTVAPTRDGAVLTSADGKYTYDSRMRLIRWDLGGGWAMTRNFGNGGETMEIVSHGGEALQTRSTSADRRREVTAVNQGPTLELHRDLGGLPTTLLRNGVESARITWLADGRLESIHIGGTEVRPRRNKEGWPNGVLVSGALVDGQSNDWLEKEWDLLQRPVRIKDSTGLDFRINYNSEGRLSSVGQLKKNGTLTGMRFSYVGKHLTGIDSSWDRERFVYADNGTLSTVEVRRDGRTSTIRFDKLGRRSHLAAFDGSSTTWAYFSDDAGSDLRGIELPSGERVTYAISTSDGSTKREARLGAAVVRAESDNEGRLTSMTWRAR